MIDTIIQKYLTSENVLFLIGILIFISFLSNFPDISLMFFASFVIACSLEPLVKKLIPKFSRSLASTIVLIGAILFICAFFVPVIIAGMHEINIFSKTFPQYVDYIKGFIESSNLMNQSNLAQLDINSILSSVTGTTSKIFSETITAGKNVGSAFVYFIVSILITFYFMADGINVRVAALKLFPKKMRKRASEIIEAIAKRSGGYIVAQIVTMSSVGIIVGLGLFILGNEYALLLGLMSAIFDIIPIVGPALAFVICIISVFKSGTLTIVLTAVIFALAQLVENNFVRPFIFSKFLDLHPLIIFLFLFMAAKYMGVAGVVFAPAIAATVVVLIEEIYIKNME